MMPMLALFNLIGYLVGIGVMLVLVIYPLARIHSRVGWNPWLSLLWLVPGVNLVMLWLLAFGRWNGQPDTRPHR